MPLQVETIVNGPFQENCFIAYDDASHKGIFIDPGAEPERLMKTAARLGVDIIGIYNTHGHVDHTGGVSAIKEKLEVPFAMHPDDDFLLQLLPDQARMFGIDVGKVPTIDILLRHDDKFQVGALQATVIHTPGHSPGGICFLFGDVVFAGDTLFAGSIGRTDLWGGSTQVLLNAIQTRLLCLNDNIRVFSGHGPATTIGKERQRNPFLNGRM